MGLFTPIRPKRNYVDYRRDVAPHLVEQAIVSLSRCMGQAPMKHPPEIIWRRLRSSAGLARFQRNEIILSSLILQSIESVESTLVHEYAHLLAFERHGKKAANHGPFWQECMVELGQEPKRCHRYETPARQHSIIKYRCKKCGFILERKRLFPKGRIYLHRQCEGRLELLEVWRPGVGSDRFS